MKQYYIYILTNKKDGVLYIGVTNDLTRRVWEHKQGIVEGFSSKYQCKNLVYYETAIDINRAITREKQIKKWKREWKIRLIEKDNPDWKDLYCQITK